MSSARMFVQFIPAIKSCAYDSLRVLSDKIGWEKNVFCGEKMVHNMIEKQSISLQYYLQ